MSPIALLSVSDKTGLIPLAKALINELGFKIISSGGTANLIESENLPVTRVADYTGFPEILEGRVKTLTPKFTEVYLLEEINNLIWMIYINKTSNQ